MYVSNFVYTYLMNACTIIHLPWMWH
jgi:hypothetical protein